MNARCLRSSALTSIWNRSTNHACSADKSPVQTANGMLPVWRWWETGLWGSGCETGVNLSVRCGSLEEARRTMSGSSPSLFEQRSNTIPRPASAAGADPRSPTHTSAQENKEVPLTTTKKDNWDDLQMYQFRINSDILSISLSFSCSH